jgi:hypothetical protein
MSRGITHNVEEPDREPQNRTIGVSVILETKKNIK